MSFGGPPSPGELLAQYSADRTVFVFDFDGTLVELSSRPDEVRFEDEWKNVLDRAARRYRTAICTGRGLSDLTAYLLDPAALDLIGNHGLEWRLKGERPLSRVPQSWARWREERLPWLVGEVARSGGWIEDKGISLTLHYRGAVRWSVPDAGAELSRELGPEVDVLAGKACWNVLTRGASKGEAMAEYARRRGVETIVYFGDEPTDETVFSLEAVRVVGVKVGDGETEAEYRVADVAAVRRWMGELARA